jgi:CheY-like chemotaxis protein
MPASALRSSRILIVEDVQETRDSIMELLTHDGYWVDASRDEDEAVERVMRRHPDLILISLGGSSQQVLATAKRIRARSGLGCQVPIVIFSLATVREGAEEQLDGNIYLIAPDNFDQLRALLMRLVRETSRTH